MGLAILAGRGDLPAALLKAHPEALYVTIKGTEVAAAEGARHLDGSFEKLGALFQGLKAEGVDRIVFAGAIRRPALNPARFDRKMLSIVPRLMPALGKGDDTLLRLVVEIFEDEGITVLGAHEAAPELLAPNGHLAGPKPGKTMQADATRARAILSGLAPLDVGQSVVVAAGQCLGIETLQGTDALIRFVGDTDAAMFRGKSPVLVKRPKDGQDLRMDLPTVGPMTIEGARKAGIGGIELAAGGVLILDRAAVTEKAAAAGISLWATP
ncbi:MAG: UDP-2,3-diacylglucosamine diphosphatase LpxI [Pseudomonadota bacterium]